MKHSITVDLPEEVYRALQGQRERQPSALQGDADRCGSARESRGPEYAMPLG